MVRGLMNVQGVGTVQLMAIAIERAFISGCGSEGPNWWHGDLNRREGGE